MTTSKPTPKTTIDGVIITPLKKIPDERGMILHMLRNDAPHFEQFGEVYFSFAYPQVVKGWHLHTQMTLNYAIPVGMIKLVLFDNRDDSPTKGTLMEIFTGEDKYELITIPKNVWNGYKVISSQTAIVANCATHPHTPGEMERMDPFDQSLIKYDWQIVMK